MGAPTDNRKRFSDFSPLTPPSKKLKRSFPPSTRQRTVPAAGFPPPEPLRRLVHGPQRALKAFGLGSANSPRKRSEPTVNFVSRVFDGSEQEPGDGSGKGLGLEDYRKLVVEAEEEVRSPAVQLPQLDEEEVRSPVAEVVMVERKEASLYKELYESSSKKHDSYLNDLEFEIKLAQKKLLGFRLGDEVLRKNPKEALHQPFAPFTDEDEVDVHCAMKGAKRHEVLVTHKASNIEITRELLQCLSSSAWLNDEVINLYLELLKEREKREPKRFLKCHFFNTFFYKRAKYLMDEVNDKSDKQIDVMSWKQEAIKNLPLQENGYDCGMFMLKYIDFYSRGLNLTFGQEHMPYFRKRTAKEILRLRAE